MPDREDDDLSGPHVIVDVISDPREVEATQVGIADGA
jgi:hypothetical protein